MDQQLRILAPLLQDTDTFLSTHIAAHSFCNSSSSGSNKLTQTFMQVNKKEKEKIWKEDRQCQNKL